MKVVLRGRQELEEGELHTDITERLDELASVGARMDDLIIPHVIVQHNRESPFREVALTAAPKGMSAHDVNKTPKARLPDLTCEAGGSV